MKTVQDYLKTLERNELIETYLFAHPIEYEFHPEYRTMTVDAIRELHRELLGKYIDWLSALEIKAPKHGRQSLLYVYRRLKNGHHKPAFGMVQLDELLKLGSSAEDYAYLLCEQAEIMGYLVADTPLTQRYLYELIADVMFEASWFGFRQEHLEEELCKLEDACREAEEGKRCTLEKLEAEFGMEPDHESPDEKELSYAALKAELAYADHSREKERAAILRMLRDEGAKQFGLV